MYAHRGRRVLYLAHPRTASNATRRALMRAGFDGSHDHHARRADAGRVLGYPVDDSWLVLTTVRNPFDVLASWRWVHNMADELWTVERWDEVLARMRPWVEPGRLFFHAGDADRVLRYENLEDDLNDALAERGLGPVTLPRWNVNPTRPDRDYRAEFTPAMRRKVEAVFAEELDRYGYRF